MALPRIRDGEDGEVLKLLKEREHLAHVVAE